MIHHNKTTGFTLIELMLSMAFVGILIVAIAMTTIHIMVTYTKGLTVREVNQAGRIISEDVQRTIASTAPFTVSPARTGMPSDPTDGKYVVKPGGGRLCTGTYTYAWNYGKEINLDNTAKETAYNKYRNGDKTAIRFVKVDDFGGALCADLTRDIEKAHTKDLLGAGDRNLAIQEFTISSSTIDNPSGQALYAIDLVISTNDLVQINSADDTCLPPSQGSGFEQFCAINKFNIIARAGNRSGSL